MIKYNEKLSHEHCDSCNGKKDLKDICVNTFFHKPPDHIICLCRDCRNGLMNMLESELLESKDVGSDQSIHIKLANSLRKLGAQVSDGEAYIIIEIFINYYIEKRYTDKNDIDEKICLRKDIQQANIDEIAAYFTKDGFEFCEHYKLLKAVSDFFRKNEDTILFPIHVHIDDNQLHIVTI